MGLAELLYQSLGGALPLRLELYDGSTAGPADAKATLRVNSPRRARPLPLPTRASSESSGPTSRATSTSRATCSPRWRRPPASTWASGRSTSWPSARLLRATGLGVLRSPTPPPEEVRLTGGLHTRHRDREAISHHYDVSNAFYRLVLGPSMVYSCAVWDDEVDTLEEAQAAKLELICRKLGLEPGMRLLDVGCGWGSMVMHAARHHGVQAVGITISAEQAALARERVEAAGLVRPGRDPPPGLPRRRRRSVRRHQLDRHVRARRPQPDGRVHPRPLPTCWRPGVGCSNHAISRPGYPQGDTRVGRAKALSRRLATAVGSDHTSKIDSDLMRRYVFPDGELHEVGVVVSMLQENGFEVRHLESLREHYALTLRHWVSNLEANWDAAVAEVGEGRARVWRLYMAACAVTFTLGGVSVQQVLAVKTPDGASGLPLRPDF